MMPDDASIDAIIDAIDEDIARFGTPIWEPEDDDGSAPPAAPSEQYARMREVVTAKSAVRAHV
jgi:hypothetical protein